MQQMQQATRPEIATGVGLSLVSTNAAVAKLEAEGVLLAGGTRPSGGGRPVRVYHFNPKHAVVALITARPEAHSTLLHYEMLDMQGHILEEQETRFAQLHAESLDEWLDTTARHHRLQRICLPPGLGSIMQAHLQKRHGCQVQEFSAAEALLSRQDERLTLLLHKGQPPQGAMRRHGRISPCPLLHLLPLPAEWETLNYDDHTLVEEMLARLLQLLTCTFAPADIELHADFWNDRLISRLRFNLSTKLRGIPSPPQLHFKTITTTEIARILRRSAVL